MTLRFETIQVQMTIYGGLSGAIGGGLLGAGFIALTYNPFFEMNILLILIGMIATTLVGGGFGLTAGFLSGFGVSLLTTFFFRHIQFQRLHRTTSAVLTVLVTLFVFFQVAYAFGRPFIWDTQTYPSWIWAMLMSLIGAMIVSTLTMNAYINDQTVKRKPAYVRIYVENNEYNQN